MPQAPRRFAPRDCDGRKLRVGDVVRVVRVPRFLGRPRDIADTVRVFEHVLGTYRRVRGFDEVGEVEIELRIRGDRAGVGHTIWIEPHYLRLKRPKSRERA